MRLDITVASADACIEASHMEACMHGVTPRHKLSESGVLAHANIPYGQHTLGRFV